MSLYCPALCRGALWVIGLGTSGLTLVSCFGGGVVRLGRTLCFLLGFSAGTVCVSEGGERGRGVFTSPVMVVLAVMELFGQRRLCLYSLSVGSMCMPLRKSRLRLWALKGAVVGPLGLLYSLGGLCVRFVSGCAHRRRSEVCSRGVTGTSRCRGP